MLIIKDAKAGHQYLDPRETITETGSRTFSGSAIRLPGVLVYPGILSQLTTLLTSLPCRVSTVSLDFRQKTSQALWPGTRGFSILDPFLPKLLLSNYTLLCFVDVDPSDSVLCVSATSSAICPEHICLANSKHCNKLPNSPFVYSPKAFPKFPSRLH